MLITASKYDGYLLTQISLNNKRKEIKKRHIPIKTTYNIKKNDIVFTYPPINKENPLNFLNEDTYSKNLGIAEQKGN